MRHLARIGGALALLPALAAGADLALPGAAVSVPLASIRQLRFSSTLRQQYDFSCGSAALATLLTHHYAHPVSEQEAFQWMFVHGDREKIRREGFSLLDMQRYLASLGFRADGFKLPLQALLDARLPAIVLVAEGGYHHFVVLKGADDGRILLGDPSRGTRSVTRAQFESIWINGLLFVIHDTAQAPAFNQAQDWRAAPRVPLADGASQAWPHAQVLPKFGPGDF